MSANIVGRVVKADNRMALLKTAGDDLISLHRDSYKSPWSDIVLGGEVVIAELDKTEGNLVAVTAYPPLHPGEWDRQLTLVAEEASKSNEEFEQSPLAKRVAAVLAEADAALAYVRSHRDEEKERRAAMNAAYEMSVSDFDGHEGDWE